MELGSKSFPFLAAQSRTNRIPGISKPQKISNPSRRICQRQFVLRSPPLPSHHLSLKSNLLSHCHLMGLWVKKKRLLMQQEGISDPSSTLSTPFLPPPPKHYLLQAQRNSPKCPVNFQKDTRGAFLSLISSSGLISSLYMW